MKVRRIVMRKTLKSFERGAEKNINIDDGILKLAFFDVDLKNSQKIFEINEFNDKNFSENFEIKSGEWYIENGWIVEKKSHNVSRDCNIKKRFFW